MKKKSILLLSIITIIALLSSCNLDSTDGIGTLVRNDQYEELLMELELEQILYM